MNIKKDFENYSVLLACAKSVETRDDRASLRIGGFADTETFDDAIKLARYGWIDGAKKISVAQHQLKGFTNTVEYFMPDVVGDFLDVGMFCSGEPECWFARQQSERQSKGTKQLHIHSGIAAHASIKSDLIFRRGASLLALIRSLRASGMSVKLTIDISSECSKHTFQVTCCVMDYGADVSDDLLAFVLCHPASLRRIGFAVMESQNIQTRAALGFSTHDGYGHTLKYTNEKANINVPDYQDVCWNNDKSASAWIDSLTQTAAK